MKIRTSCLLLTALLLAGCWQKSLNPFYTTKDLVSEPKLVGAWKEHKESDTGAESDRTIWTFTDTGEQRFALQFRSEKEQQEYEAHVFRFEGQRFLDILLLRREISVIPAHHLFKVVELGTDLKLVPLNIEWVQKWLKEHPGSLSYLAVVDPEHPKDREQDELVLTADTKALQSFLRAHLNDQDFFGETMTLKKQTTGGAENVKK